MAHFVKLYSSILTSTIWQKRPDRDLFITALLLARPQVFDTPTPQLEVDSLKETGWKVPPGRYGFAPVSGPGLFREANIVDDGDGREALRRLGEPEGESRSQAFDGRRLVRVNHGYIVLNYAEYREYRDLTSAERSKRWRDNKHLANTSETPCNTDERNGSSRVTPVTPKRHPMIVARERKVAKETDPRFAPLRAIWEQEWVSAIGTQYRWLGARDAKALHSLLAIPELEFRARARKGITATGYARCSSVSQLASKWNDLAMPVNGETKKLAFAPAYPDEAFTGGERPI